jgi:hypothetical protein
MAAQRGTTAEQRRIHWLISGRLRPRIDMLNNITCFSNASDGITDRYVIEVPQTGTLRWPIIMPFLMPHLSFPWLTASD